jgi:hypothetical protein
MQDTVPHDTAALCSAPDTPLTGEELRLLQARAVVGVERNSGATSTASFLQRAAYERLFAALVGLEVVLQVDRPDPPVPVSLSLRDEHRLRTKARQTYCNRVKDACQRLLREAERPVDHVHLIGNEIARLHAPGAALRPPRLARALGISQEEVDYVLHYLHSWYGVVAPVFYLFGEPGGQALELTRSQYAALADLAAPFPHPETGEVGSWELGMVYQTRWDV